MIILDYINSHRNVKTIKLAITFTEELAKVVTTTIESKSIYQRITTVIENKKGKRKQNQGVGPKQHWQYMYLEGNLK